MKGDQFLAMIAIAVALAACGPTSSGTEKDLNVRDWVGHSANHLVQSWGKPHHDYPTADGGRAIGYLITNDSIRGPTGQVVFPERSCMINFTVDSSGIIDDATTTGTKCRIGPHGEMHPPANRA